MTALLKPDVLGCFFDIGFVPPIAAMHLHWNDPSALLSRTWLLPAGELIQGPLPTRFGLRVHRQAENAYALALVWDSTYRQWFSLRRIEILGTAIEIVLKAMGTPLPYLLDQPIGKVDQTLPGAA